MKTLLLTLLCGLGLWFATATTAPPAYAACPIGSTCEQLGAGTGQSLSGGGGSTLFMNVNPAQPGVVGGIKSTSLVSHQWLQYCDTAGTCAQSQPGIADISGLGTAAAANTGTSGATLGLLNTNNTHSGTNTFSGLVNFTSTFEVAGFTITFPGLAATLGYQSGAWTTGNCLQAANTSGGISDAGAPCGTGGGGGTPANPTGTAGPTAVNGVLTTYMRSDAAPAVQKGSNAQFGLVEGDDVGVTCVVGVCGLKATTVAGTSQTVSAALWGACSTFVVTTSSQTLTLPVSSSLSVNGCIVIQTIGQSVTIAPNAADAINGGTAGVSATVSSGLLAVATTNGSGAIRISPTTGGGGSVSVTAGTPDIVITPSPGTGTFTVGSTVAINAPADGGSHSYTALSGDGGKCIELASTFTTLVLPQATGSFASGYATCLITKSTILITSTTSKVNNIAGATGLKVGAYSGSSIVSDSTDWQVGIGVPVPTSQPGTTYLADDGTYSSPSGSGTVNSGTANQLAYYASSTNAVSGTNAIPNGTTATTQSANDNSTKVATTAYADRAASANVFTATIQWIATVNPNNATVIVLPNNSTLVGLVGNVETATGGTATVSVNVASSGTACSAGTTVHSGSMNANGTAATNQTLNITTTAITTGQRLCLVTTGTTAWTAGTGVGSITASYTTTPVNHSATVGWIATVNPLSSPMIIFPANSTLTSLVGTVETATGGTATVSVKVASSGTACGSGTTVHSGSMDANGTAATNQTLTLTTTAVTAGQRLCLVTTGTTTWTSGTGIGGITVGYTTP